MALKLSAALAEKGQLLLRLCYSWFTKLVLAFWRRISGLRIELETLCSDKKLYRPIGRYQCHKQSISLFTLFFQFVSFFFSEVWYSHTSCSTNFSLTSSSGIVAWASWTWANFLNQLWLLDHQIWFWILTSKSHYYLKVIIKWLYFIFEVKVNTDTLFKIRGSLALQSL